MNRSIQWTRPTQDALASFERANEASGFSYEHVGGTVTGPPEGWRRERQDVYLGNGREVWDHARQALDSLRMFDIPWVSLHVDDALLAPGRPVTFASWQYGVWMMNACRIAVWIDETTPSAERYGFAYGTLPGHAVAGEERFLLEWNRQTDAVTFEISKFSRLVHPLARLVAPLAERVQTQFTSEALAAMAMAVRESSEDAHALASQRERLG